MKTRLLQIVFLLFASSLFAQVSVRPAPARGYEKRIKDYIDDLHVVDTHEHLLSYAELKRRGAMDFMILLTHYSADDLKSAGMTDNTFKLLLKDSLSVAEKWKILKPFWESSSNTAYNRISLLAASSLYNINDINESTVEELSEKIRDIYRTDWIATVLDKAKIDYVIQMNPGRTIRDSRFRDVIWFDNYISISSKERVRSIAAQKKADINNLDDYVNALTGTFRDAKEQGIIAVKSALAYNRTLFYENVSRQKAEEVFNTIMMNPGSSPLPFEEVKPLQDYLMHRVLDLCKSEKVPFIFHTGLQSGNGNQIENSDPALLVNLFREYPEVDFILLHGGYPYGGETAAIVKYFRNVFLDMAWIYAISPSFGERYLNEWLETVPESKLMGFGGDYFNVENLYGHLMFAKQIITKVLVGKVRDGYFSEDEARIVAKKILHDNALRIYRIVP
jgi:hypothetical protein